MSLFESDVDYNRNCDWHKTLNFGGRKVNYRKASQPPSRISTYHPHMILINDKSATNLFNSWHTVELFVP